MDFVNVINNRTSVRKYKSQQPTATQIANVLEAARQAPSACNRQPWHFYVIKSQAMLAKMQSAYNREWLQTAPMIIVIVGNHAESWHRAADSKDHCDVDIAIATEHLVLAATNEGLATCWICNFDKTIVSSALNLSADDEPIVMLPIGYAADVAKPHQRKEINDIVTEL